MPDRFWRIVFYLITFCAASSVAVPIFLLAFADCEGFRTPSKRTLLYNARAYLCVVLFRTFHTSRTLLFLETHFLGDIRVDDIFQIPSSLDWFPNYPFTELLNVTRLLKHVFVDNFFLFFVF